MSAHCILITGGTRSGKSAYAQKLATDLGGRVLFVATAEAKDTEMAERIARHRRKRPRHWQTLEATRNLGAGISREAGDASVIVIDCLTLLVSNLIASPGGDAEIDRIKTSRSVKKEIGGLLRCIDRLDATFVVVTNEVGLGLVPANPLGRLYRDLLGEANQTIAERADEVYFMASGIAVRIK